MPSSWSASSNALKPTIGSSSATTRQEESTDLPKIPKLKRKEPTSTTVTDAKKSKMTPFHSGTTPVASLYTPGNQYMQHQGNALSRPLNMLLQQQQPYHRYEHQQQPQTSSHLQQLLEKLDKIRQKKAMSSVSVTKKPTPAHHHKNQIKQIKHERLVGTKQELEKQYLRTTSDLKAEDFRPYHILLESLPYVVEKYNRKEGNYEDYLCEQLKAIRQDLTVQSIENEFTVKVYETHARIALLNKDVSEFNQCQTRLKDLYSKGIKGNTAEFLMYNIIYLTLTDSSPELNRVLKLLPKNDMINHPFIKYAMMVQSSLSVFNYYKLFNTLYLKAPALGKSLIEIFAESIKKKALNYIYLSHMPTTLSVSFVCQSIQCSKDFLEKNGAVIFDGDQLDTRKSYEALNK